MIFQDIGGILVDAFVLILGIAVFIYGERYVRWWNRFTLKFLPKDQQPAKTGKSKRKKAARDDFTDSSFFHIFIRVTRLAGLVIAFFSAVSIILIISDLMRQ